MVRSLCLSKRCPHLKKKTSFFPYYKLDWFCMKLNRELSKIPVCPLEDKRK